MIWSQEMLSDLQREISEGRSNRECASLLAAKYNIHFTPNMVSGKFTRMGLVRFRKPRQPRPAKLRVRIRTPKVVTPVEHQHVTRFIVSNHYGQWRDGVYISATIPKPTIEVPLERRRTFADVGLQECKFPYGHPGDADFYFCGGERVPSRPYCEDHCRIAYYVRPR